MKNHQRKQVLAVAAIALASGADVAFAKPPGSEHATGSPAATPYVQREVIQQPAPDDAAPTELTPSHPGLRTRDSTSNPSVEDIAPTVSRLPGSDEPSIAERAEPNTEPQGGTVRFADQQRQVPAPRPPVVSQGTHLQDNICVGGTSNQSLVPRGDTMSGAPFGAESGSAGTAMSNTGGAQPGGLALGPRIGLESPGGLVTPGGAGKPLAGGGTIRPQSNQADDDVRSLQQRATREDYAGTSGNFWQGDRPAGKPGAVPQLTPEQRNVIRVLVAAEQVTPLEGVQARVGGILPQGVQLQDMPTRVVTGVPSYMGYKYAVANGQILIVDPVERRIVNMIPAEA